MAKRARDLAKRGTGGVTGGSGQVTRLAGLVVPRAQRLSGSPGGARAPGVPHRCPAQAGERPRPLDHSPRSAGRRGHQLSASRLR